MHRLLPKIALPDLVSMWSLPVQVNRSCLDLGKRLHSTYPRLLKRLERGNRDLGQAVAPVAYRGHGFPVWFRTSCRIVKSTESG